MDKSQIIGAISDCYISLSHDCVSDLIRVSEVLECSKETLLVKEGQFSTRTFFIAKGCARAFYLKDGKDISDWFAFENDFISSINSFFLDVPSPHYIQLLDDSVLLAIERNKILSLSDKYREIDRLEKLIVTKTMLQLQQRITSVQFESAQQKFKNLLQIRPDITQRVPLTHIASYLGITLETLSRIRRPDYRI